MIPINIEIKNFFSHKNSVIDFEQFNSALLIGNIEGNYDTSNGSGKSAILEAILWALFNKSRAAAMDDIIFWGENLCKVTFTFKHKDETYRVIRKRSRITSTSTIELSIFGDSGAWVDISETTSGLTNEKISSIIKLDYKTFVNSAYFRQNDISEFAESDAGTRKTILKSIIDISKWDEYERSAKDSIRDLKSEINILSAKTEDYDDCSASLEFSKKSLEESHKTLNEKIKRCDEIDSIYNSLRTKYEEIKSRLDTDSWDKTTEKLLENKETLKLLLKKIESTNKSFKECADMIKDKRDYISKHEAAISELKIDDKVDEKIKEINEILINYMTNLSTSTALLGLINNREISLGQCYVCKQGINDNLYNHLIAEHDREKEKHNNIIIYCENKIKESELKLKILNNLNSNNKKKQDYLLNIKSSTTELEAAEGRLSNINIDKDNFESKIFNIRQDISIEEGLLNSIRDDVFRDLQKKLSSLKDERNSMVTSIGSDNQNVGVLTEKVSNLKQKIEVMDSVKKELLEKQKKNIVFDKLAKMFGKNGIQTILLNAVIEDLEKTANDILVSICNEPFIVYLETQRTGSDGVSIVDTLDLKVKKDGVVQDFKSLSGGEQFRISLALRIALSEISSRHGGSSLEFLLLDEINSPLDRHGTESLFVNVIKALEKKYKILVITHNDSLKEKFETIIDVTKINGESYISLTSI